MMREVMASSKKKIHIWSPAFVGFGGGITAFSRELALVASASGYDVVLIGKGDQNCEWGGMRVLGARGSVFRLAKDGIAAARADRPDFIVGTHLNFGPLVQFAASVGGSRYALVAHGVDVHPGLSLPRRFSLNRAGKTIAVSNWTRHRLLSMLGLNESKVSILPNTCDFSRFYPKSPPEDLRYRYRLAADEKVILTVARLDEREGYKGYDRVMRALPAVLQSLGRVRYLIIGQGKDRQRLQSLATSLGVEDSVTFAGFVHDDELADHYRLADMFAMPSTGEGFGIVFLEALGCGTPVLAGNQDGSVDALDQGRLGVIVDPNCVGEIAKGIVDILSQRGEKFWFDRHSLASSARVVFGREAFAARVRAVFDEWPQ